MADAKIWKVEAIPEGSISDDGMTAALTLQLEDGSEQVLSLAFAQLDFLGQAFLSLAKAAHERQLATGRLAESGSLGEERVMVVEALRVSADAEHRRLLVQMTGHEMGGDPFGISSAILDIEAAEALIGQLRDGLEQFRQKARPS